MVYLLAFLALQVLAVLASYQSPVVFNWDIDWVTVAPDGFSRPAIGINGQWPCPPMEVNIGDRVIVNVHNKLKNETTAIHFHGIFQTGSNQMDGPAYVTQCPIDAGACESQTHTFGAITNVSPNSIHVRFCGMSYMHKNTYPESV
jgi:iron transport multicopper oxidase